METEQMYAFMEDVPPEMSAFRYAKLTPTLTRGHLWPAATPTPAKPGRKQRRAKGHFPCGSCPRVFDWSPARAMHRRSAHAGQHL